MSAPLRILHVVDSLAAGGMENGIVNMAHALEPRGFEMHVACLSRRGVFAERMPAPERVVALDKRSGFTPAVVWRLMRQIARVRPALIHSHNLGPLIYSSLATFAGRGVPLVQGEHSQLTADERSARRLRQRRILYRTCRSIHTVSDGMRTELLDLGFPQAKIQTVRNGVNTQRFAPGSRTEARNLWGIPEESLVVGMVGRFGPFKGHDVLLDAFDLLVDRFPSLHLLIAGGGGSEEQRIRERIQTTRQQPRIHLTGFQTEPQDCYRAFDLLVVPSINEGMSNAALEAMACGIPVLGNPGCGHEEILTQGEDGWIANLRTPEKLASELATRLAQPESLLQCGRRARQKAETHFSLHSMADAYEHLYRTTLSPHP